MLIVNGLTKIFNIGTVNENVALKDVSFSLEEGDFVTLIGGNGSGKSTLLNCIAGVYPVEQGSIIIDGSDVTKLNEHKRAGMLGVFSGPDAWNGVKYGDEENLALALRRGQRRTLRWGISNREREQYKKLLKKLDLGLEDRLGTKVGLLSGGQRQALTLVMATLKKPRLLLLDEHTSALDPKTAQMVLEISDQFIRESRITTLMVTHNMRDAIKFGNRLIMMHNGRIILDIRDEDKQKLTIEDLLKRFGKASGEEFNNDTALLS